MTDRIQIELRRIADADGPASVAARIALGDGPLAARLDAAVRALAGHRGAGSSTCPSDAARAVGAQNWRTLMDEAGRVARELARAGQVEIIQRGEVLDPDGPWHGPIRIRAVSRR